MPSRFCEGESDAAMWVLHGIRTAKQLSTPRHTVCSAGKGFAQKRKKKIHPAKQFPADGTSGGLPDANIRAVDFVLNKYEVDRPFSILRYSVGCRDPPSVSDFESIYAQGFQNSETEERSMAIFERTPDYRAIYPEASDKVIKCLRKGHRKMQYAEYDLKVQRCKVDADKQKVTFIPSREDSLERLMDEDKQFKDETESLEDTVVKSVMIAKMMECVAMLPEDERELIMALYFQGKTQTMLEKETGVKQQTNSYREKQIRGKLKKMMEK